MSMNKGTVIQVVGPVLDIRFPDDRLPQLLSAIEVKNGEATIVAEVTKEPRLVLEWKGEEIVNLSRAFLDTNGAHQSIDVSVGLPKKEENYFAEDNALCIFSMDYEEYIYVTRLKDYGKTWWLEEPKEELENAKD